MAMTGPGGRGELNSDINVTPLVDVMLVLLIIFMVTAPMLNSGLDIELPQAEASIVPDDPQGKLILSVDKTGKVALGDVPVKWEELEVKLATNAKVKADSELYIDADTNLPYGTVIKVMSIARKAGVQKLLMMTEPVETTTPPASPPSTEPAR